MEGVVALVVLGVGVHAMQQDDGVRMLVAQWRDDRLGPPTSRGPAGVVARTAGVCVVLLLISNGLGARRRPGLRRARCGRTSPIPRGRAGSAGALTWLPPPPIPLTPANAVSREPFLAPRVYGRSRALGTPPDGAARRGAGFTTPRTHPSTLSARRCHRPQTRPEVSPLLTRLAAMLAVSMEGFGCKSNGFSRPFRRVRGKDLARGPEGSAGRGRCSRGAARCGTRRAGSPGPERPVTC